MKSRMWKAIYCAPGQELAVDDLLGRFIDKMEAEHPEFDLDSDIEWDEVDDEEEEEE